MYKRQTQATQDSVKTTQATLSEEDKAVLDLIRKNPSMTQKGAGVSEEIAREALRLAQHKLPIKTKIIARADQQNGEDK